MVNQAAERARARRRWFLRGETVDMTGRREPGKDGARGMYLCTREGADDTSIHARRSNAGTIFHPLKQKTREPGLSA
jgi:hypothetical protein